VEYDRDATHRFKFYLLTGFADAVLDSRFLRETKLSFVEKETNIGMASRVMVVSNMTDDG
jgi:hypothetical protein